MRPVRLLDQSLKFKKMNNVIQFFLLAFALTFSAFGQSDTSNSNIIIYRKSLDIIPKPKEVKVLEGWNLISQGVDVQFDNESPSPDLLISVFKKSNIKVLPVYPKKVIVTQSYDLKEEGYELNVTSDTVFIKYGDVFGLKHATTTFSQLVLLNKSAHASTIHIPIVKIKDWPRFEHRGLLLDCSRHFFEKEVILKYIDLLALYKMNVLHWHLTEDQAWRIAIDKYPRLESVASKRTEFDGSEYSGIYSKEDIREIVKYATSQGIEVIPEIELPGHSQAAIAAYPHLSCTGKRVEVANDWGVFKEIYCAGNDSVFIFLEDVLTEVVDLFPSKYIHIGGDEAPKSRWEECPKCQKRIETEGLKDEHELQSYFIKRIQSFLKSKDREIIGWDEILEGGLAEGAVVQSWRGFEGGIAAAQQGNKVIMSPTSHAYLDYDLKSINLEKIYSFNPIPKELAKAYRSNIIGGECNMWTEHVPDEKTLDQKVFPRMLGIAEALWSHTTKDYTDFNRRIQSHYAILERYEVTYGEESHPFTYSTFTRNDSLFVELIPATKDLKLTYQFAHGVRDNAIEYQKPIYIDSNKSIHVQAFKNNKPYFCVLDFPLARHKAIDATVSYESECNEWYTAGGEHALVDGKLGTFDFRDGNWQGFWGNDAKVKLSFEEVQRSKEVRVNAYQYNNSWIFIPTQIELMYSKDGNSWNSFGPTIPSNVDPKKRGKFIHEFIILSNEEVEFKYLKLQVKNLGKVPEWHEAAGSDAWIFMDEIQVK